MDYIDNNELKQELISYSTLKKSDKETIIPKKLAMMFQLLAKNLLRKGNFSGYTFKDELYSDAIFDLIRYSHNYDENKGVSAFAYITTIAYQSMVRRIKKEKQYHKTKIKILQNTSLSDIYDTIDGEEFDNEYLEMVKSLYETHLDDDTKVKVKIKKEIVTDITRMMEREDD